MARASKVAWMSVAVGFALTPAWLSAQAPAPMDTAGQVQSQPSRVHMALRSGTDYYRRGDYELAAVSFQQAQAGQDDLTPGERQDLATWIQLNMTALQARRQGSEQLRLAEQAVQEKRNQEALNALKAVTPNQQFLTPTDKQRVLQLTEKLNSGGTTTTAAPAPNMGDAGATAQARSKLKQARLLMSRGDFNAAQSLALETEKLNAVYMMGEDTPVKVLEDIHVARTEEQQTSGDPKNLMSSARAALSRGDLDRAERLANQAATSGSASSAPWGDSPAKVLKDVQAARARQMSQQTMTAGAETASVKPLDAMSPTNGSATQTTSAADTKVTDPRVLMRQAREAYASGKLDDAEKLAMRANGVRGTHWGLFEDTPEKLLVEIRESKGKRDADESGRVLAEARKALEQGNLVEAEKLSHRAERLHGPYKIWELGDRPSKVLAEVEIAKIKRGKNPTPASEVAKKETTPASPSSLPRQSDNSTMVAVTPPPVIPSGSELSPYQPIPPRTMQVVAGSDSKPRAQGLLSEARQMQKEGRLLEARAKALEAQKLGATFGPEEDRPETALLALSQLGQKRIDTHVSQASDYMGAATQDPTRYARAEMELTQARQLAVGFGLDTQLIDTKLNWVLQMQGKSAPSVSQTAVAQAQHTEPAGPAASDAMQQHGKNLLNQARMELRAGQTGNARRLAESAFNPQYGVQAEASQVLRSIDTEEFNQRSLTANRSFDAGLAAYSRREFSQAAMIFNTIDPHLLTPDKQTRLKDVMQVPEMQGQVAQVGLKTPASGKASAPGTAQVSDIPATPGTPGAIPGFRSLPPDGELAQQVKAMNEVKFQKLRSEGLQVMSDATKRFQAGDTDRALDMLQDYTTSVNDSGLDADKVTLLRRPVDNRLTWMKTLKHQKDFEKLQASQQEGAQKGHEREVLAEENKKRQMGELMKQFHTLYKEGKYKEAETYAMRAHELDPDDGIAATAVYQAKMQINVKEAKDLKRRKEDMFVHDLNQAEDPGPRVNSENPLAIDPLIAKISKDRKPVDADLRKLITGKTDKEREIYRRLDGPISSLDYKDMKLRQILDDLQGWTGLNIISDEPALNEAGISLDRPVTIKLEGVAFKSALNLLLHQVHLTWVVKDEALVVTTEEHARGRLEARIHPVLDLVVPINNSSADGANVLKSLGQVDSSNLKLNNATPWLGLNSMGGGTPVGGGQSSNGIAASNAMTSTPTVTKENPKGTLEDTLIKLITNTIAPQSWTSMGGQGTIEFWPLGMALVVNQTPDIQEQIQELLQALRRLQDQEVAVEVRFITIAESFFERIGVDFNINIRNNQTKYEPQLVSQQFRPFGFINHFTPANFVSGLTPAGNFTQDLNIPVRTSSFNMAVPPFGAYPGIPGGNGGINLGLAFLSDIEVYLFMEASQGDQRTNVMQAPKLTLFNGQTSTITVNDSQFFVTNVQVVQAGGQVVFVPQNTPFPTGGVALTIQAVISADRRFVRLSLTPNLTNLSTANVQLFPITTFITPIFEGGAVGQPIPFTQFLQQPVFNTISVNTTVNVPDGGTVLLGGLKRLSEGRNEFGPPILSKIPYLNRLFKNVGYGRETESLLMMVTPRVIINEEEELRQVGPTPGAGGQ